METRQLTSPLADRDVPAVSISAMGRFVTLISTGTRVLDTRTGGAVELPGIVRVVDVGTGGIVGTTGPFADRQSSGDPAVMIQLAVFDHHGKERMRVPFDSSQNAWLDRNGNKLLVMDYFGARALTYDVAAGKVRSDVRIRLPKGDSAEKGVGWTEDGRFVITRYGRDQDFFLDPATGATTRIEGRREEARRRIS